MSPSQPRSRHDTLQQNSKLMRRMMMGMRARMDEELKPQHCTLSQLRMLYEIQQNPGVSSATVARACDVTPQSAQTMLVRAVERGWARRTKSPLNERLVTAELTRAGERLLDNAKAIKSRIEAEIWADVPLTELRQMNAALGKALANLERTQAG